MSSPVSPLPSSSPATGGSSSSSAATNSAISSTASLGDESTFLQLLVAQIKNQDPTQPVDSNTFLTQLAEFSQLEQLIGIRQDVSVLDPASTTTTGSSGQTTPASGAQS